MMPLTRERSDIPFKKSSGEGSSGGLGDNWVTTLNTSGFDSSKSKKSRGREKYRDERRERERELRLKKKREVRCTRRLGSASVAPYLVMV
jgi:hypothetical protein